MTSGKTAQPQEMVSRLERWIAREGMASYDWWDLWGTPFGRWAKSMYVRNHIGGSVCVSPLLLMDILYPSVRRWFSEKKTFPICHANIGLGYLNMFELGGDGSYLQKAGALVQPLLDMASPMARGLGWGLKHEWMTVKGIIPIDTPCHTQTAYGFEFFSGLHRATGKDEYLEHLHRIAEHTANDFHELWMGERLASSYSTIDDRRVVNANSYRALILLHSGQTFGESRYTEKGIATVRYVLSMQKIDGSWSYSEEEPFVDHYHTCFVLKNLFKVKAMVGELKSEVEQSIEHGLEFYFTRLFYRNGYPKPFAVKPRLVLHRYDSYDLAECIGLLSLMKIYPERLTRLLDFARREFQTKEGWFIFREYPFVPLKGIPYMRYANSAMFFALTNVILAYGREKHRED